MHHSLQKTARLTAVTTSFLAAAYGLVPAAAWAQVAGRTTAVDVTVAETTQLARGWSVRKALLGKSVYNEAGQKIGRVEDLIVSPDKNVSYVIVGAGGFIGIGRHNVAIPVAQIKDQAGRLVMPGATKESIKALPTFDYAGDTQERDRLIATAEHDIAAGKGKVVAVQKRAAAEATDAKARLQEQATALQADVKAAEARLAELKHAAAARWQEFEAGVSAATAKLRKSIEGAAG
jgi:sporulation protein YlmC with PRC-barrel domain